MVQQFAQQQLNDKRVVVKAVPKASAPAAQEAK